MVAAILRQVVMREQSEDNKAALNHALRRQIARTLSEGRWHFADHFCDRLLAEEPRDLEALLVKGVLAWRHFQDLSKALSCFRQVVILGGFESSNECVAMARASLAQLLEQLS
jgi:hypothetical protein